MTDVEKQLANLAVTLDIPVAFLAECPPGDYWGDRMADLDDDRPHPDGA